MVCRIESWSDTHSCRPASAPPPDEQNTARNMLLASFESFFCIATNQPSPPTFLIPHFHVVDVGSDHVAAFHPNPIQSNPIQSNPIQSNPNPILTSPLGLRHTSLLRSESAPYEASRPPTVYCVAVAVGGGGWPQMHRPAGTPLLASLPPSLSLYRLTIHHTHAHHTHHAHSK
jgi:hypothetical protein